MSWEIRQGDALTLLKAMPESSMHCVVTSPPYWGLRDYKVAGQFGLEKTPEDYVDNMVEVFREVKRVMRDDATLFLNLGDSYWGGKGQSAHGGSEKQRARFERNQSLNREYQELGEYGVTLPKDGTHPILKPKDLCGIPWRVAFALQAEGWWLRSAITLCKLNPMPESVQDRPTSATEMMFLLTKSSEYFYDIDAVRTLTQGNEHDKHARTSRKRFPTKTINGIRGPGYYPTANLRNWWVVTTEPFKDAHFATFGEHWIEPCIRAGTSERGCCAKCRAPWKREIKASGGTIGHDWNKHSRGTNDLEIGHTKVKETSDGTYQRVTVGWHPTCSCQADTIPCVVLDPFAGSGTTGVVALKLQRSFLGIELNTDYVEMAKRRIGAVMPLFDLSSS